MQLTHDSAVSIVTFSCLLHHYLPRKSTVFCFCENSKKHMCNLKPLRAGGKQVQAHCELHLKTQVQQK